MPEPVSPERALSPHEHHRRLALTLMRPAAMAAYHLGLPMDWLKGAMETAAFAAGRDRGDSLRQISQTLHTSHSRVALCSRALKRGLFGTPSARSLDLHIERMLSAEALTLARLNQILTRTSIAQIEDALDRLEDAGRIFCTGEGDFAVYQLDRQHEDAWTALLHALEHTASSLSAATHALLQAHEDASSLTPCSHTHTLVLPREALPQLDALLKNPRQLAIALQLAATLSPEQTARIETTSFWRPLPDDPQDSP